MSATPPLLLAALLLAASGLVKLRAALRSDMGFHLPSLVEVVGGLALVVLAVVAPPGPTAAVAALMLALALLLGSSLHLAGRARRRNRFRHRTEGRRLETYLRYLSDQENGAP